MHPARDALVVSWDDAPPVALAAAESLLAEGRELRRLDAPRLACVWVPGAREQESGDDGTTTVLALQQETRGVGGRLDAGELTTLLESHPSPAWSVQPPCVLVVVDHEDGSARVTTDQIGFGHVYLVQGKGWAAASTSSRVLARLAGLPPREALDLDTWGIQTLLGWQAGGGTGFTGVTKLAAGSAGTLVGASSSARRPPVRCPRARSVAPSRRRSHERPRSCDEGSSRPSTTTPTSCCS